MRLNNVQWCLDVRDKTVTNIEFRFEYKNLMWFVMLAKYK